MSDHVRRFIPANHLCRLLSVWHRFQFRQSEASFCLHEEEFIGRDADYRPPKTAVLREGRSPITFSLLPTTLGTASITCLLSSKRSPNFDDYQIFRPSSLPICTYRVPVHTIYRAVASNLERAPIGTKRWWLERRLVMCTRAYASSAATRRIRRNRQRRGHATCQGFDKIDFVS